MNGIDWEALEAQEVVVVSDGQLGDDLLLGLRHQALGEVLRAAGRSSLFFCEHWH